MEKVEREGREDHHHGDRALQGEVQELAPKRQVQPPRKEVQGQSHGIVEQETPLYHWRFAFDGKTKTVSGVKYEWCTHHGHKNDKGNQRGMYMEARHDHPKWIKNKEEKQSVWKSNVAKREKPDGGGNTNSTGKLSLAKNFKSALTTHVKLSDKEAEFIMKKIEKENKEEKG